MEDGLLKQRYEAIQGIEPMPFLDGTKRIKDTQKQERKMPQGEVVLFPRNTNRNIYNTCSKRISPSKQFAVEPQLKCSDVLFRDDQ